jgi:hypothetical protein
MTHDNPSFDCEVLRFAQDDMRFNVLTLQRFNRLSTLRPRLLVVARRDRPLRTHEALPR